MITVADNLLLWKRFSIYHQRINSTEVAHAYLAVYGDVNSNKRATRFSYLSVFIHFNNSVVFFNTINAHPYISVNTPEGNKIRDIKRIRMRFLCWCW